MVLISCENLVFSYGKNVAVEIPSLEICSGDYFCIVGENGSGKSTLLKGLVGLKASSSGNVVFSELKRREIGYMPQKADVQKDFPAGVFEIVLSGCFGSTKVFPFYSKLQKNKALYALKLFKIEGLKNRPFKFLSIGQQQKVLLARAVCSAGKILFLDEPCSSLDPKALSEVYDVISRLNKEKNIAVVMVSHDVEFAVKNATKIIHLKKKPLFLGDAKKYCESDVGKRFLEEYKFVGRGF